MSLTRDAIITEVMGETGRTDKTTYLQTVFPDVLYAMSRAVTEDGEPIPLQDLKASASAEALAITNGTYYVALPTGFIFQYGEPELLYDTDKGRQLIKKSLEWFNYNFPNRANNTSNKSKPSFYCLEKNRVDFAPMSDSSYTIMFPHTILHPAVTTNAISILFSDHFKDVIKHLLKSKLWNKLDDEDKEAKEEMRGLSLLRSLAVLDKRNSKSVLITDCNNY